MQYTNYRDMETAISKREPFKGSSVFAEYAPIDGGIFQDKYCIYSYDTCIAVISRDGEVVKFNDSHYSATTSRLQNMIKKVYGIK